MLAILLKFFFQPDLIYILESPPFERLLVASFKTVETSSHMKCKKQIIFGIFMYLENKVQAVLLSFS